MRWNALIPVQTVWMLNTAPVALYHALKCTAAASGKYAILLSTERHCSSQVSMGESVQSWGQLTQHWVHESVRSWRQLTQHCVHESVQSWRRLTLHCMHEPAQSWRRLTLHCMHQPAQSWRRLTLHCMHQPVQSWRQLTLHCMHQPVQSWRQLTLHCMHEPAQTAEPFMWFLLLTAQRPSWRRKSGEKSFKFTFLTWMNSGFQPQYCQLRLHV